MGNVRDEPEPYVIPLSADGTEALSFDTGRIGGWAAYFAEAAARAGSGGWQLLLRIGPEDSDAKSAEEIARTPWEIRELRVVVDPGSAGFASSLLREIPVLRIEAAVNRPAHRDALAPFIASGNRIADDDLPGGMRYLTPPAPVKPARIKLRVSDPGGYRKPDDFYRQIGERYLWLASISGDPAKRLAESNGVDVGTVHRWVREAKARGLLLLPAHRGKR